MALLRPLGALPRGAGRERALLAVRCVPAGHVEDLGVLPDPAFLRRVRRAVGATGRVSRHGWAEAPLDDEEALLAILARLEALEASGAARFAGGQLTLWLEDDPAAPLEWFELDPARSFPLRRSAPYKKVSAGDLPAGCHVASGGEHYVSETFKRAVEEEGLRGLDLLWVEDVGRYRALQWYEALPAAAIGRGLDHPWFDRAAFEVWWRAGGDTLGLIDRAIATSEGGERTAFVEKREALLRRRGGSGSEPGRGRFGARQFDRRFFRAGAGFPGAVRDRLVHLFAGEGPLDSLRLVSPAIVLRRFLPATDFAFTWGTWDGSAGDGDPVRFGRVCFNRRVRDVLIARQLVREEECRGVLVLEEPPVGVPVFDDPDDPPPPLLTLSRLAELRSEEARLRARWQARARPERPPGARARRAK